MNDVLFSGDELRQQRESLGLSPQDVFEEVRIPVSYVEALERADFQSLPALSYAASFLRTYCVFLNLPSQRIVDCFQACARQQRGGQGVLHTERDRWLRWKEDLMTWAAICAILVLGWCTYSAVVRPESEIADGRVEAETREMLVPDSNAEWDY